VKIESQWFRINGVNYASENRVEFSPPFEPPFEPPTPPVEPRTWHLFRCVDINRNVKYGPVSGKFDPVGVGELERIGVKNATKDKIDSKNWFWEGKKIEA